MKKAVSGMMIAFFFTFIIIGLHFGIFRLLSLQGVFLIRDILVKGNVNLAGDQVIASSALVKGSGMFETSLLTAAANAGTNRFIEYAEVWRLAPGKIEIRVKERKPVAVVTDLKDYLVCDRSGFILAEGVVSGYPVIQLDFSANIDKEHLGDSFVTMILQNLSSYANGIRLKNIYVRKQEGVFLTVNGLDNTLFFLGKGIPDSVVLDRAVGIADKIKTQNIKIKYVDVNKENAIGFKS